MPDDSHNLSQIEQELKDYDAKGAWPIIYHKLRNDAILQHNFPMVEARRPENRLLNRYRDVSPYDHSRVKLQGSGNNYINASLVQAQEANRQYILAQGPLPNTVEHFWLMVWQQSTKAVIMLNRVVEKGMTKCAQYFPLGSIDGGEDDMTFSDVGLKVTFTSAQHNTCYTLRTLELENTYDGSVKEVLHFHFTTWPDFGVPPSPRDFLEFLYAVRESGSLDADVGPPVIHCSAGIGRSGTFCLVDTSLVLVANSNTLSCLDLRSMLMEMRTYRVGLIQTHDQLRFSYLAIIEGAKHLLDNTPLSQQTADNPVASQSPKKEETPPPLPPRRNVQAANNSVETEENSDNVIRRRNREERKKKTSEQIEKMREKQKQSEISRRRRLWIKPYLKPLLIGLGIAALYGGYQFYKHFYIG